jgi:hypothetical protein
MALAFRNDVPRKEPGAVDLQARKSPKYGCEPLAQYLFFPG